MAAIEVETLEQLLRLLASGTPLRGARLQDLDLTGLDPALLEHADVDKMVVLGCELPQQLDEQLRVRGALVFPREDRVPFDPWRAGLYTARELYADPTGEGYSGSRDARTYRWSLDPRTRSDVYATLLQAIHDDSIADALAELVDGRRVVGVMGGHALDRGTAGYADAAHLGHTLAADGAIVATGGGPGAMEAANLGALFEDATALAAALDELAGVPSFRPSVDAWATIAFGIRDRLAQAQRPDAPSLGVPTWFYGHEPPNVFAAHIAKYFSNALREDALLAICTAGIVVLPGAAGTVQEIFQAATRLFYATESDGPLPPLVLVDERHWQQAIPAWEPLRSLAEGRPMQSAIHLVGTVDEAAAIIAAG
ncbi:LOG family protein [Rudaeicoccus suwonensis]|uniref:Putative Rossmann-fold nucleotide-binding protein n=1 Tax=Rudaeicoccus suwonensis TaxID=657409 RepID=A0A561EBX9_9MICO|nr:LOG family protein [Rudaeicoccus suwonensis]TWE13110.1 putative Rossmann-fold nucleotide-binding protein [Rudaeicoccus suwonensis]